MNLVPPGESFRALSTAGDRLRIALFSGNYDYTRDGANQALQRLVDYLVTERGCDVRIYSPTVGPAHAAARGTLIAAPSVAIPGRPEYRLPTGLTGPIRTDLSRFAPHLVHLSSPDPLAWGALHFARSRGAPIVASVHTRFETYLPYYGLSWLQPLGAAYLRAFYRRCDYVLTPSEIMARSMFPKGLDGRVRVWGRGVDADQFAPARRSRRWRREHGFGDDDVVVLFFGRLVKEKGLAVFAEALARSRALDRRMRALVVGAGPADGAFRRMLDGAVFTGMLSGPELGAAVASADILLNPSRTEAFSNVTLEGMAAGLALVCADAPAHRALIGPGCGLLSPADDAGAFADILLRLAADPQGRQALGEAARRRSLAYRWPEVLADVFDVYAEALTAKASRPSHADRGRAEVAS